MSNRLPTGVGRRAQFTRIPPGSSQGAATGGSGHAHANLRTAGDSSITTVKDIQEAVAHAGVCETHLPLN